MGLADRLEKKVVDNFYDRLGKGVTAANPVLKRGTPPVRDLREQSRCWIGADSNDKTAFVFFKCDSKSPDVVRKNKNVEYANGVDLANITNSRADMGYAGWWPDAVEAAIAVIVKQR